MLRTGDPTGNGGRKPGDGGQGTWNLGTAGKEALRPESRRLTAPRTASRALHFLLQPQAASPPSAETYWQRECWHPSGPLPRIWETENKLIYQAVLLALISSQVAPEHPLTFHTTRQLQLKAR